MDFIDHIEFEHVADRHLSDGDYDGSFFPQNTPSCKWCGKRIHWFAVGQKWVAHRNGQPHRCDAYLKARDEKLLAALPELDEND
jgi:hypothetical protein